MASTVLSNGIIIPEKYSRDWYADLYHNWQELDNLLGGGTPKDGTLTIQKNGSTVGTFSANQATNETINITVPDVNDGTLTIQQNGTTVDSFTANSSTDKTVNITVPTKTSDLTNDSNFVPSTDLATVATSGSYNDLTDTPTIPTVNDATLTIQQNGTDVTTFSANASANATANITVPTKTSDLTNDSGFITSDNTKIPLAGSNQISGDLIPSTDGTVNLGSSTSKWKAINGSDVTGIGHIGWAAIDQTGDVQTYTRTNPNVGQYAHYCVAPDNGWVSCREYGGRGTFQVCSLAFDLNSDPTIVSPPLNQYQFGSIPVRKGEYYAIISNNESAYYTMIFICNNG